MTGRNIREKVEAWARWLMRGRFHHLGYGKLFIAKLLDGMPGRGCPLCRGTGKVYGITCEVCHGTGKVKLNTYDSLINPAFIRASYYPRESAQQEKIDRLFNQLPAYKQRVVLQEHFYSGTQEIKAKRINIGHLTYRVKLREAYRDISAGLSMVCKR